MSEPLIDVVAECPCGHRHRASLTEDALGDFYRPGGEEPLLLNRAATTALIATATGVCPTDGMKV